MELILNPPYKKDKKDREYITGEDYDKYLKSLPTVILYLYLASVYNRPVGGTTLDNAIRDYPEYFKIEK